MTMRLEIIDQQLAEAACLRSACSGETRGAEGSA
jgi:hypothetical protein